MFENFGSIGGAGMIGGRSVGGGGFGFAQSSKQFGAFGSVGRFAAGRGVDRAVFGRSPQSSTETGVHMSLLQMAIQQRVHYGIHRTRHIRQ